MKNDKDKANPLSDFSKRGLRGTGKYLIKSTPIEVLRFE